MPETIKVETFRPGVAKVLLNRPDKRNAMSPQLHLEMAEVLEELRYDRDTRVLVITGAGTAFCAGQDIREMFAGLKDRPDEFDRVTRVASEWRSHTLRYYPKPVISMVNGYCFGGALSIVEGSDIAVAANEATFGISEVNFGSLPAGTVSKSMAVGMRTKAALLYGLSGRSFDGVEAARIGLVAYAVPGNDLADDVGALAAEIADKDPDALRATKEAFRVSVSADWDASVLYAGARVKALRAEQAQRSAGGKDRESGIDDFLSGQSRPGLSSEEG